MASAPRFSIAVVVATLALVVLSSFVLAQQGEFLRSVNDYGPTYYPQAPADLRLPAPTDISLPAFGNYSLSEIMAITLVNGDFAAMMIQVYKNDLGAPNVSVNATIAARTLSLCKVEKEPKNVAELDCLLYFKDMGLRAHELSKFRNYNQCLSGTQMTLTALNQARVNGTESDLAAIRDYAVLATGLKWCQLRFGKNLTVVPPTAANTIPTNLSAAPLFEPTGPERNRTRSPTAVPDWDIKQNASINNPTSGSNSGNPVAWMIGGGAAIALVIVIVLMIVYYRKKRQVSATAPQGSHEHAKRAEHPGHSPHKK